MTNHDQARGIYLYIRSTIELYLYSMCDCKGAWGLAIGERWRRPSTMRSMHARERARSMRGVWFSRDRNPTRRGGSIDGIGVRIKRGCGCHVCVINIVYRGFRGLCIAWVHRWGRCRMGARARASRAAPARRLARAKRRDVGRSWSCARRGFIDRVLVGLFNTVRYTAKRLV